MNQSTSEPDWIAALRLEVEQTSEQCAGQLVNLSGNIIKLVLKKNYPNQNPHIELAVRGTLMGAVVRCPVLGPLRLDICLHHQTRNFAATCETRIELYYRCRGGCKHSLISP